MQNAKCKEQKFLPLRDVCRLKIILINLETTLEPGTVISHTFSTFVTINNSEKGFMYLRQVPT